MSDDNGKLFSTETGTKLRNVFPYLRDKNLGSALKFFNKQLVNLKQMGIQV